MQQKILVLISTATICYVNLGIASGASATTFLSFTGEPDDYISGGTSATFTRSDGRFDVSRTYNNGISIGFTDSDFGGENFWSLQLVPPQRTALVPGRYEGATGFPFQAPTEPGLNFSGNGRYCYSLTGAFNIQDIVYDFYGEPARFQADFEQRCVGGESTLFGQVAFDRNDFDADNLTQLFALNDRIEEYETALYYFSQPGDYVGAGLEQTLTPVDADFSVYTGFGGGTTFSISTLNRGLSSPFIDEMLSFIPPTNTLLAPGLYDRAVRSPNEFSGRSGLDFSHNGRGCGQAGGRFQVIEVGYGLEVLEAGYEPQPVIERFDALFEQHCEDELAISPALFGRIRYNATVVPTTSKSVPEPTTILGILTFGGWLISQRKRTSI